MKTHRKVHYYCYILMTSEILNLSDINFLKQKIKRLNKEEQYLCNVPSVEKKLIIK